MRIPPPSLKGERRAATGYPVSWISSCKHVLHVAEVEAFAFDLCRDAAAGDGLGDVGRWPNRPRGPEDGDADG